MKKRNISDTLKYHISVDPYKEEGYDSIVIATDAGFVTKDSREVWDIIKPVIKEPVDKFWITTVVSGTINNPKTNMDFIKDSKYKIDTK